MTVRLLRSLRRQTISPVVLKDETLQHLQINYNSQRFYGPQKYFCYAPFGSIFISYNGKASPCYACKAEDSLLHKSMDEVWNGPVYEELRNQFKNGVIPDACSFCRDHLMQENYGSILANKYDHYLLSASGNPVIAELELSNNCNLECVMCTGNLSSSIRKNRENLPPIQSQLPDDFLMQFVNYIPTLRSIELTGGDPFLIDIYYKILQKVETLNPKLDILITTNANTMTIRAVELLKKNLRLSFNVSIDSLEENNYALIRKNASLKTALNNINIFSDYTRKHNTSLGFLVCPLKYNWKELPHFVGFANKYHATLSYHVVFKPAEHALWSYPQDTLKEIYSYLSSFTFTGNDFNSNINLHSYKALVTLIGSWHRKAILREQKNKENEFEIQKEIESARNKLKATLNDVELFNKIEGLIVNLNSLEIPELIYIILAQKTKPELIEGLKQFTDEELISKLELYHKEIYSAYFYTLNMSDNDKYINNAL